MRPPPQRGRSPQPGDAKSVAPFVSQRAYPKLPSKPQGYGSGHGTGCDMPADLQEPVQRELHASFQENKRRRSVQIKECATELTVLVDRTAELMHTFGAAVGHLLAASAYSGRMSCPVSQ